ncbi:MAG: hypothetical protein VB043_03350 [Petrimonas sp.]|nr:hypothetical protein [Petrimonas sp.]
MQKFFQPYYRRDYVSKVFNFEEEAQQAYSSLEDMGNQTNKLT